MRVFELEIFGRKYKYDFGFQMENNLHDLEKLLEEIKNPQILSYCGMETIIIFDSFICSDCMRWIYETFKKEKEPIRDCLLRCSVEDVEWTKNRNKGLTDIFYRKVTFLPEVQDVISRQVQEYISALKVLYAEYVKEEEIKKAEYEEQKKAWTISHVFKKVMPSGGEYGKDGYIDAEYISQDGKHIIRMVNRDVFDFGCYAYPKRVEGEDVFCRDGWTKEEIELAKWLKKYSEFRKIRM